MIGTADRYGLIRDPSGSLLLDLELPVVPLDRPRIFFDGRHALLSRSPADSYLLRNVPGDAAAYLAIATKIIVQETSPEGVRRYTAQCLFENDIPALRALR